MTMREALSGAATVKQKLTVALLSVAGRISHDAAKAKVDAEFAKWDKRRIDTPSAVERHFAEALDATKTLERVRKSAKAPARKGGRDAS